MKRTNIFLLAIATTAIALLWACSNSASKEKPQVEILSESDKILRGQYLVNGIGCDDCHSPKRMGPHGPEIIPELRLSGYPADRPVGQVNIDAVKNGWALFGPDLTNAVGPWGMSFAANLTPDETGIKNWTEHNFLTAIKHGKLKGLENSRSLLPPMPWEMYKNLTDEDLKSIFAYLKSLPAVPNLVPAPISFDTLARNYAAN